MIHGRGKRGLMCYQQSILRFLYHASPLIVLLLLVPPSVSESPYDKYLNCLHPTAYPCGNQNYSISFPFWSRDRPEYCSYPGYELECSSSDGSMLLDGPGNNLYQVKNIDYQSKVLTIAYPNFDGQSCSKSQAFTDATLNFTLFSYFELDVNLTLYTNCTVDVPSFTCQSGQKWYYDWPDSPLLDGSTHCRVVGNITMNQTIADMLPWATGQGQIGFMNALQKGFGVRWSAGQDWCDGCLKSGGACGYDSQYRDNQTCYCPNNTTSHSGSCKRGSHTTRNIIIGVGVGVAALIVGCFFCFFCYQRRKRRQRSNTSNLLSSTASSKPSSIKDPELGTHNYNTHVFTYEELQEATNGFDASRELGDGGFGTVYKGTLRDGRVVAVKRLYENNYKRVEQFVNEVQILSGLRHQNLVTLYGCTSHHSRELLLVYEFVPNGTVADHLHGLRATEGSLTWEIRLSIAIETASALAYLHAIEPQIIHRDVKTNNILLDDGFHVKVADFGLSRLFPVHATHVSTLPQGTPGYVDPEYHQCYQLTDKSDVYSFGVVLVELISSKPAVDISRHRHEINLANMAITKIQNNELDQLIDPGLGYQADWEMERMINTVAELAFRCLQGDRNMRPSIKEVMEELRAIQNRGEKELVADVKTTEDTGLLKNTLPYSPDSVTKTWESASTTPNTSS